MNIVAMDTREGFYQHLLHTRIRLNASPGICISLIMLATIFRLLIGIKSLLENHQMDFESDQKYPLHIRTLQRTRSACRGDSIVVSRSAKRARAWQMTVDGPRAAIDTVMMGVLYLLMLPIMTMNAGYCLSILFGIVLGNLAMRKYSNTTLSRRSIGFVVMMAAAIMACDFY